MMCAQQISLTNQLTPWSRVLPEKLKGFQLVKKFHCILWNVQVHYHICYPDPDQASPCLPIPLLKDPL